MSLFRALPADASPAARDVELRVAELQRELFPGQATGVSFDCGGREPVKPTAVMRAYPALVLAAWADVQVARLEHEFVAAQARQVRAHGELDAVKKSLTAAVRLSEKEPDE